MSLLAWGGEEGRRGGKTKRERQWGRGGEGRGTGEKRGFSSAPYLYVKQGLLSVINVRYTLIYESEGATFQTCFVSYTGCSLNIVFFPNF